MYAGYELPEMQAAIFPASDKRLREHGSSFLQREERNTSQTEN